MLPDPIQSARNLRQQYPETAFQLDREWLRYELENATFEATLLEEAQHLEIVLELPEGYELSLRAAAQTTAGFDVWGHDMSAELAFRAFMSGRRHNATQVAAIECLVQLFRKSDSVSHPIVSLVVRERSLEWVVDKALLRIREQLGVRLAPYGREAEQPQTDSP